MKLKIGQKYSTNEIPFRDAWQAEQNKKHTPGILYAIQLSIHSLCDRDKFFMNLLLSIVVSQHATFLSTAFIHRNRHLSLYPSAPGDDTNFEAAFPVFEPGE